MSLNNPHVLTTIEVLRRAGVLSDEQAQRAVTEEDRLAYELPPAPPTEKGRRWPAR